MRGHRFSASASLARRVSPQFADHAEKLSLRGRNSGVRVPISEFMEYRRIANWNHSGLMLAVRITLPHFSVSSAMWLPKSVGEPGDTVPPRSASLAFILGSARAA